MVLFYIVTGGGLLVFSLLSFLSPGLVRKIMSFVLDKDLFFLVGVLEIALGLGVLYFRHQTGFRFFIYVMGFLFFFDGIMYMISPRRARETYSWLINMDSKGLKAYALITLFLSAGLIVAGVY